MPPPEEESPGRALVTALVAMGGVALLVGVAVGLVAVSASRIAGLGEGGGSAREAPPSLYMPKYSPTKAAAEDLGLPELTPSQTPGLPSLTAQPSPKTDRITLFVAPQQVSPGQRINFNGVYVDGEGVALQIQRKEGGTWSDFPVTATVRGGVFETWIQTSQTGTARFRVLDEETDRASNVVVVQIG